MKENKHLSFLAFFYLPYASKSAEICTLLLLLLKILGFVFFFMQLARNKISKIVSESSSDDYTGKR